MTDLTLESLAKRVEALEQALAEKSTGRSEKDWRKVIGMFHDSEFMRKVDEQCQHDRELERARAAASDTEDLPDDPD
jgi:hypothetical protein